MDNLTLNAQPVAPSEQVAFRCRGCGACCRHVRESVPLSSLDAFRLAKHLRAKGEPIHNTDDVYARYAEPVLLDKSGFTVFMLKTAGSDDACIFLEENRCTIQQAKPTPCRLYPFVAEPKENWDGFKFLVSTEKPHHFKGGQVQVKRWMKKYFSHEDREFLAMDMKSALEIVRLLRQIPERDFMRAVALFLWYKFSDFELDQPFLEQYQKNLALLIIELSKLVPSEREDNYGR